MQRASEGWCMVQRVRLLFIYDAAVWHPDENITRASSVEPAILPPPRKMTPTRRSQRRHKSIRLQLQKQTKTTLTPPPMSLRPQPLIFGRKKTQTHTDLIKNCYSEIVHWKPQFVTLSKNKTGHCFIESLSIIFNQVAEKSRNSNVALYYAIVMPHPVLARTKENRETSTVKTI